MTTRVTARTLPDLAEALGVNRGTLSRWAKRPWFPPRGPSGWRVEAVRAALAKHVDRRGPRARAKPASAPSTEPPPVRPAAPVLPASGPSAAAPLTDDGASALAKAAAAVALASRLLADADAKGEAGPREVGALARALEELRRGEAAALALAKQRGELIERVAAAAVASRIAQRLVELLANLEASVGSQLCIWLADQALLSASAEVQARTARRWLAEQARSLRELGAAEIERMLTEETNG